MPLFDYLCRKCDFPFEQLARSSNDPEAGVCPKCGEPGAERKIPRFRVGGRGDLRESTDYHGCHPAIDTGHDHSHGHDHGHDHGKHDHSDSGDDS